MRKLHRAYEICLEIPLFIHIILTLYSELCYVVSIKQMHIKTVLLLCINTI